MEYFWVEGYSFSTGHLKNFHTESIKLIEVKLYIWIIMVNFLYKFYMVNLRWLPENFMWIFCL